MSESKYQFEQLTPNNNVELGIYEDAINYVFDNPDIKNVAISGPYSSGKSSILESYKNKHKELAFMHISLAHFNLYAQETEDDDREITNLEGKIINQLIYQLQAKSIPQTDFKLKMNFSFMDIVFSTIRLCLFLFSIVYCIYFDSWCEYVSILSIDMQAFFSFSIQPMARLIAGLFIMILCACYLYKLVSLQKNKNILRKLSLQGNEIEIFEEGEASYFDKYLNEVLYLLENTQANVLVFEDIDRYDLGIIFERLREINLLVNVRRKHNKNILNKNKPLRFFYLLRDDIFISKDRTKFFDYIIPVVPILDSSNSYDQIIQHLQKFDLRNKFNEKFLRGISLYIDDMRILKNICNEFLIYYNKLNKIELDLNKLFAIIMYKNFFPRDFNDLQLNRGYVYTVFSEKLVFVNSEIEKMQQQIERKQQEIELINEEHLQSIHELNIIYAYDNLGGYYWYNYSDERLDDELKRELSTDAQNIYLSRKRCIDDIKINKIRELRSEIDLLEFKISEIRNKKLAQIITQTDDSKLFYVNSINGIEIINEYKEIKGNEYFDLLKYLIRNGYIDENYADYMSYFYANSISVSDKIFIRSVLDRKSSKGYNYHLDNPELIISCFELVNFDQKEILNMELFVYLLRNRSYKNYLNRFIQTIKEYKAVDFIKEFLEKNCEISIGVKCLNEIWPKMFSFVWLHGGLTDAQIYQYSILTIYYNDYNVIKQVNEDNILSDYISNQCNYLAISGPNITRLIDIFKWLEVKFVGLNYNIANKDLFQAVYDNSLYEINFNNISLMLDVYFDESFMYDIKHKNYTKILSQPNSPIAEYINDNFDEYLNIIIEESNNEIYDDENVVINLLNNNTITDESKKVYINASCTSITSLKSVNNTMLWKPLLEHKNVLYSEKNVIDYFIEFSLLDECIINFINDSSVLLDFSNVENLYEEDELIDFSDSLVQCGQVDDHKYRQILSSLNYKYNEFCFFNISNNKMRILIELNILIMNPKNLKFMRTNYTKEQKNYFILTNINKYVEIMTSSLFSVNELFEILDSDVDDELKLKLLNFTDKGLSVINKNYSVSVCKHILQNNLEERDLTRLFSSFENWSSEIQEIIMDYAIERISTILENCIMISDELKERLLLSNKISEYYKINLLIAMISNLNSDNIETLFVKLSMSEFVKIFKKGTRPRIEINDTNKNILVTLKTKNIIISFEEDTKKPGYFKVRRT